METAAMNWQFLVLCLEQLELTNNYAINKFTRITCHVTLTFSMCVDPLYNYLYRFLHKATYKKRFRSKNVQVGGNDKGVGPEQQFGSSLGQIRTYYKTPIPPVLQECVNYLNKLPNLTTENLFKLSADIESTRRHVEAANSAKKLLLLSPHEATTLILEFLRALPDPLILEDVRKQILNFQGNKENGMIDAAHKLVQSLPEDNYAVLKFLTFFLGRVAQYSGTNRMSAAQLAVLFGPFLTRPPGSTLTMGEVSSVNYFVKFLIENCSEVFSKSRPNRRSGLKSSMD